MTTREGQTTRLLKRSRTLHSAYKFARIANQVSLREWTDLRRLHGIFQVLPNTMVGAAKLINAYEALIEIERDGIEGDVAECGVWSGGCIGLMALASRRAGNTTRRFHLFDSFQGLPQPSTVDEEVFESFRRKHPNVESNELESTPELVPIGACVGATMHEVERFLSDRLKVDPELTVFHPGWFQDTLPVAKQTVGPLAILRMDGDWYDSTKVVLENLFDNVVENGFVIVDDYGDFSGCRKAVHEFFETRGMDVEELLDIDGDGVYFRKS